MTPSTGTPASTILKDGRALRMQTMVDGTAIWAAYGACTISTSCGLPAPVPSTGGCLILNVFGQGCVLASPAFEQDPHSPPSPRIAGGPRPCGSSDPRVQSPGRRLMSPPHSPSPASPTRACAP